MALHLIVDGYNLVGGSSRYVMERGVAMELARETLLEDLRRYKRNRGHRITVVFDGEHTVHATGTRETIKGIRIVYSRAREKADDVILRMIEANAQGAVVVTSDRELSERCRRLGATTMSARGFAEQMSRVLSGDEKGFCDEEEDPGGGGRRKRGPSRRPSKRQRADRRKLIKL